MKDMKGSFVDYQIREPRKKPLILLQFFFFSCFVAVVVGFFCFYGLVFVFVFLFGCSFFGFWVFFLGGVCFWFFWGVVCCGWLVEDVLFGFICLFLFCFFVFNLFPCGSGNISSELKARKN